MKFNKQKFLETELGTNLIDCIKSWDNALCTISRYSSCATFRDEYRRAREVQSWCQAQWEVYQLLFKQFYKLDCHFSRTDEYFGIVTDDNNFLFKFEREV